MSRPETDAISIRAGSDSDIPAVIELMRLSLGEGNVPRTSEFWHWKHRQNPFGASPMWLAHSAGQLVGVRLFMRWRFHAAGHSLAAVRAVDTATHPEFQGKGIFKRLTLKLLEEEKLAGTHLVFNTPNAKSRPGYLKMGWQSLGRLPIWVAPHRPFKLLRALSAKGHAAEDDPTPLADAVRLEDFRGAESAGLLEHTSRRFHTAVNADYLGWRYGAPGLHYGAARESDALLVFRVRRRGELRELRICDAFSQGFSARSLLSLRRCLAQVVARHRPDYVISALNPELQQLLRMALMGFVLTPGIGPILTVRLLAFPSSAPDPTRLGNWSASIGDLELF